MNEFLRVAFTSFDPTYYFVRPLFSIVPLIVFLALLPILLWGIEKSLQQELTHQQKVAWMFFFNLIGLAVTLIRPKGFSAIISRNEANSYYSLVEAFSLDQYLSILKTGGKGLPLHAISNMPGKSFVYYLFSFFHFSPDVIGVFIFLLSSLIGLILYFFVIELGFSKQTAWLSAILYWFYPARLYFMPLMNVLTPFFAILPLYFQWKNKNSMTAILSVCLGFLLFVLFLFEPTPLITGFVFLAALRGPVRGVLAHCLFVVLGFLIGNELVRYALDLNSVKLFFQLLSLNADFYQEHPIRLWQLRNLGDFFISTGHSTWVCMLLGGWTLLLDRKSQRYWYVISILFTLFLSCILGFNRAEIGRFWIFMGMLLLPLAAQVLSTSARKTRAFCFTLLLFQIVFASYSASFITWN